MKQTYARVKDNKDASLNEIHDVVRSIPALRLKYWGLNLHINIAERLKPTTDNVRFRQKWQVREMPLTTPSNLVETGTRSEREERDRGVTHQRMSRTRRTVYPD